MWLVGSDRSFCLPSFEWLRLSQTCVLVVNFFWIIKSIRIQPVEQYGIYPDLTFGLPTILLRFWTNICPCWVDVMYQLRSSVCATRISLGLMINADVLLASSMRHISGGPVIALDLTWHRSRCQARANETYSEAKRQFSDKDVIMNVHSPHGPLKSAVFGSSSSLPLLVGGAGGLVWESVGN